MEMQWSIVDDGCIIDLMDLGHRMNTNNNTNPGFLRSTEDAGVYMFDPMNLSHSNNMQNNDSRILRSTHDGLFIYDSMQNNHDSIKNLQRFRIEEKTEECCCICLVEFSIGSRAIRMPQPCSHIFHQHCITKWLNISHTCPLCRRNI
ncbi:hypothetical protein VNO80_25858 [Phaseolus coccineus]|uniref:RING-type domain-containing protein n=1 Tax=Phaseolus coccineus TaxID=3886 RepID=A0AAN9LUY6_PHACN